MTDNNWLRDLKAGDMVVVQSRWYEIVARVGRVTACYVIVGGTRYHRDTGRVVGEDYGRSFLSPYNDEAKTRERKRQLITWLRVSADKAPTLPTAVLEAMHAAWRDATKDEVKCHD